MPWLRHLVVLFAFVAGFVRPASAFAPASPESRVGGSEVAAELPAGELGAASREQHQGIGAAYDENASGYRLAVGGGAGGGGRLFWGFWKDYPKVSRAGREYAESGGRLYTEHAVGRMLPSGMGGRSIAPAFVEEAIATGTTSTQVVGGVTRTVYTSGTVQVVTEQGGRIVVTVNPF